MSEFSKVTAGVEEMMQNGTLWCHQTWLEIFPELNGGLNVRNDLQMNFGLPRLITGRYFNKQLFVGQLLHKLTDIPSFEPTHVPLMQATIVTQNILIL